MQRTKRAIWLGCVVWLIPFCAAMALYPIRIGNRPLFESLMPVVLTLCTLWSLLLYFKVAAFRDVRETALLGVLWMFINLALDFPMFSAGPMKMTLAEYLSDIGAAYLLIPAATIGAGFLLRGRGA